MMTRMIPLLTAGLALCAPALASAQEATVEASAEIVSVESIVTLTTTRTTEFGRVVLPQRSGRRCRYSMGTRVASTIQTVSSNPNQISVVDGGRVGVPAPSECVYLDSPTAGLVDVDCGPLDEVSIGLAMTPDANARAAGIRFRQSTLSRRTGTFACTDGSTRLYVGGELSLTGGRTSPYSGPIANTTVSINF